MLAPWPHSPTDFRKMLSDVSTSIRSASIATSAIRPRRSFSAGTTNSDFPSFIASLSPRRKSRWRKRLGKAARLTRLAAMEHQPADKGSFRSLDQKWGGQRDSWMRRWRQMPSQSIPRCQSSNVSRDGGGGRLSAPVRRAGVWGRTRRGKAPQGTARGAPATPTDAGLFTTTPLHGRRQN